MTQKLSINISLIRASQKQMDNLLITEMPSPTMLSARRRKSKIATYKNNEKLIQQAYQQLMSYVDNVEGKVHEIVQTQQGQFLQAYKQHIKSLRQQMQHIKRKSLNNSHSEKVYVEKIDVLEKQLIIFREESLRLFQKIMKKDMQIDDLSRKINSLEKENKEQEKSIYNLTKTKKQLEVQLQKMKRKLEEYQQINLDISQKHSRQFSLEQKRKSQILTPLAKQLYGDFNQKRPYTTNRNQQRSKNFSLKLQSVGKVESKYLQDLSWVKRKLQEKIGDQKKVEIQTVLKVLAQSKTDDFTSVRGISRDYNSGRRKIMMRMESNRNKFISETSSFRMNFNEIQGENELRDIFKKCVQEVRKDIVKRNNIPSINFFKENGPKSFIQFKKMDHFNLLQLLFKEEKIISHFYQMIFKQNHN